MRTKNRDHDVSGLAGKTARISRREMLGLSALGILAAGTMPVWAGADGKLVYAAHITLAPTWFDPAETPGLITPFMIYYALHDALIKAMPGEPAALSLASEHAMAPDGMSHSFTLRDGVTFHNGDPVTSDDVKFSFERYRGNAASFFKAQVMAVETPDPRHVVFRLHKPWPDFILYYTGVTGAGWIVPRKYVERVGEDGFKKAPIGAGPYKFTSFNPGIELVMDANETYWRKQPTVKSLVWKVIPDETTRLAALKRGEVDIAYSIRGELADELQRTPGLTLQPIVINSPFWIYFADQWDPKSPWHDVRVRRATALALDLDAINQALTLGKSWITNSIVPKGYDFYWQPPKAQYDPDQAKRLLTEAGFRGGFDAGDYYCDSSYANLAEAALNFLEAAGIRMKLRPIERAAFTRGFGERKYRNLIQVGSGAFGNAATRMESFVVTGGSYVYGGYPDLDALFAEQAATTDHTKRADILQRMQQTVHERAMFAPLWQLAFLNGQGPRVEDGAFNLIPGHPYSAPYEEVRLKAGA